MQNNANVARREIIFADESYEIVGAAFSVFNELGFGLAEKQYQSALAAELAKRGIIFRREVYIPIEYKSENIGRYFADFIINGKILLELKVVRKLGYAHTKQTLGYIRNAGLKLGILLYFTPDGVKYRRVINSYV